MSTSCVAASGWWRRGPDGRHRRQAARSRSAGWQHSGLAEGPKPSVHERRCWSSLLAPVYLQLLEGPHRVTDGQRGAWLCREGGQPSSRSMHAARAPARTASGIPCRSGSGGGGSALRCRRRRPSASSDPPGHQTESAWCRQKTPRQAESYSAYVGRSLIRARSRLRRDASPSLA